MAPQRPPRRPGLVSRRPQIAGAVIGTVAGITVITLVNYFGDRDNWTGGFATVGGLLVILAVGEIWCRVERKRTVGTYSYDPARTVRAWRARQAEELNRRLP